jgi:hypothetical protein
VLQIRNDGVPFPVDREPSKRMGLRIMNFRARTIGGTLDIRANGNSGTIVTCTVPHLSSSNGNGSGNGHRANGIKLEGPDRGQGKMDQERLERSDIADRKPLKLA